MCFARDHVQVKGSRIKVQISRKARRQSRAKQSRADSASCTAICDGKIQIHKIGLAAVCRMEKANAGQSVNNQTVQTTESRK